MNNHSVKYTVGNLYELPWPTCLFLFFLSITPKNPMKMTVEEAGLGSSVPISERPETISRDYPF